MLPEDNRVGQCRPYAKTKRDWLVGANCIYDRYYDSTSRSRNCGEIEGPQWGILGDFQQCTVPSHSQTQLSAFLKPSLTETPYLGHLEHAKSLLIRGTRQK